MYDTFSSYNSADEAHARTVYNLLKSSGLSPFFSRISLPDASRSDFGAAIDEALAEAYNFVLVASSVENLEAGYVQAEWRVFVDEKRAERKRGNIVTVSFGDITIASLPLALRQYQVLQWTDKGRNDLLRFLLSAKGQKRKGRRSRTRSSAGGIECADSGTQDLISRVPVRVHTVLDIRPGKSVVRYGPGVRKATQEEMDLIFGKQGRKKRGRARGGKTSDG